MAWRDPIPELKRQLAAELVRVIDGWTTWDVASMIHTDPPRISDLRHGRLERFSLESIVRFLTRMKQRVRITVQPEWLAKVEDRQREHRGKRDGGE
jgi:predicted XRE-type DNA-binding protein